ncbi:MAG: glycosyltransferase [Prevotella sp.]|nr:glycosyltransferase [Prevotella sp.]
MGSEPGMGWNWCVNLAKHCELFIVTEGEYRNQIEEWLRITEHANVAGRMHFYYNPVTERIRHMCWNQGDWRFYKYYKEWQLKTADIARDLCRKEKIDILHQLNMIGFREPGYLWLVSQETGIPFVWGPIGGLKQFPIAYTKGESIKLRAFLRLKNFLNIWQLKYSRRVDKALKRASLLVSSIPDSYQAIKKYKGLESVIIPETGTFIESIFKDNPQRFRNEELTVLWVGKFDFRKRLDIAIKSIALAQKGGGKIRLEVFGTGSERQQKVKYLAQNLGIAESVIWMGNRSNNEVTEEMRKADMLLFTSINEDTSTVVLEAISNHLPVLCFDAFGMASVITEDIGLKIPLTNPEQSVKDFAEKIKYLYNHRSTLEKMSQKCIDRAIELSWENKAGQLIGHYKRIIDNNQNGL